MLIPAIRVPLFLVITLLEKREEYYEMPDDKHDINRDYLDKVYRTLGYAVVRMNEEGNRSKLRYGQYNLDLARPPIYIEEYDDETTQKLPI
jgi:hypothetical protein